MNNLDKTLNDLDKNLQPQKEQIMKADKIYSEIVYALSEMEDIRNIEVLKQGSYKNKTLTVVHSNKDIDLDILVCFRKKYKTANSTRDAIANKLRKSGFKIEIKTRVVVAEKDNFSVDILPAIFDEPITSEKILMIKQKGEKKHKKINPFGLVRWSKEMKGKYQTTDKSIRREIDKEQYTKEQINNPINKAIRILKSFAYDFNIEYKDEIKNKISSHMIEFLSIDSYLGDIILTNIIKLSLDRIKLFSEEEKNFYNPTYEKEVVIKYEGKKDIEKFIKFVIQKLEELTPGSKIKSVLIAGVSFVVPSATAISQLGFKAKSVVPLHSKSKNNLRSINNNYLRKNNQNNKYIIKSLYKKSEKMHAVIGSDGVEYKFKMIISKNVLSFRPLFTVKDGFHTYGKKEICISKKNIYLNIESALIQLENWVEGYVIYVRFGFSGFPETGHKIFKSNFIKSGEKCQ